MHISASHPVRALGTLLHPYRRRVIAAACFHAVKDCPVWLVPVFTAQIIDTVVQGKGPSRPWLFVGLTLIVLAQNYPNHIMYVRMDSRAYRSVAADLRNALTAHLQGLSIGYHTRKSPSVIQTKVVRDVENVELLQQVFPVVTVSLSILIGSVTVTAIQAPAFLPVFALTVPVAGALIGGMRHRAARRNAAFRRQVENLSARVGEMATLIPITRAHELESTASRRVAETAETVKNAGLHLDRLNSRFETMSWVSFNALSVLCLGLAGWAAISGLLPITTGQVVLLSTCFASLTTAVTALVGLTPIISRGIESVKSITEVLEDPDIELNEGKLVVSSVQGRITFRSVTYAFSEGERPAVDGVDLDIMPGETVAFVGASGSGKSTTINLALGFIRPTRGVIDVDGTDMEALDLRTYRRFVSVVPQESVMFEATIRDNVTYGMTHVPDAVVRSALESANASEFVYTLPDGWNTMVGQRGARLSGGQRQRMAIARALIRDPRMLLLDVATSALDSHSETAVNEALDRLLDGRTSLVVAHRLSTIRKADRIVVMERGRVVELDDHTTLIAAGGHYARLHAAQHG